MGLFTIIAAVLSVVSFAASYQAAKKAQKMAKRARDGMAGVLVNKESSNEHIPVVYGERRVGGTRVFMSTSGVERHKYLYVALVLSEGEVTAIEDIEIDEVPLSDSRFNGLVYVNKKFGTDDQTRSDLLAEAFIDESDIIDEWDGISVPDLDQYAPNFTLSGVAYLALRMEYDREVFNGIPDITAKVKGRKVYDPRQDSTSTYYDSSVGVATQRANDTSTWEWSDNPSICLRDYLTNDRFGKDLPSSALNEAEFMQAADDLDGFTVTPYSGGPSTHKLFRLNAVVDTGEELFKNVEQMLLACRGFLPYNFGKYALKIDQATTSQMTLGTDKIVGDIAIAGSKKEDRFNQVIVTFPNAGTNFRPDNAVWPNPSSSRETSISDGQGGYLTEAQLHDQFLLEDGEDLIDEIDLEYCTDRYAARDLARIFCWRSRYAINVAFTATSEAMELEVGDVIGITHPTPDWSAKKFQIDEMNLNFDGTVTIKAIEHVQSIYAYDPDAEEVFGPDRVRPQPDVLAPTNFSGNNNGSALLADGTFHAVLNMSWTASNDVFVIEYEVAWRLPGDSYSYLKTPDTSVRIEGLEPGTYQIRVRAINYRGATSDWVVGANVNLTNDDTAPSLPTDIEALGDLESVLVKWTNPTDADFKGVEIFASDVATAPSTNDTPTAFRTGTGFFETGLYPGQFRHYYLRSVDFTGNKSAFSSRVFAEATGVRVRNLALLVNQNAYPTNLPANEIRFNEEYEILTHGTTDFTDLGATDNNVGTVFTATRNGDPEEGSGTVEHTSHETNNGELALVASTIRGAPIYGESGSFVWNGETIAVEHNNSNSFTVLTNLADKQGWIAFDRNGTAPFDMSGTLGNFDTGFVYYEDGQWYYDDDSANPVSFNPDSFTGTTTGTDGTSTAKLVALGALKTGSTADSIADAGLFSDPRDLKTVELPQNFIEVTNFATQLESDTYVQDTSGWKIERSGDVEFNNITARGEIHATSGSISDSVQIGGTDLNDYVSRATGSLALMINKKSGGTLTGNGEAVLVGVEQGAAVTQQNGFITWDGAQVEIDYDQTAQNATFATQVQEQRGFICVDVNKETPFTINSGGGTVNVDVAFVYKIDDQWYYDNNSSSTTGVSFTPSTLTGSDGSSATELIAIGFIETGSSDVIQYGGLFGQPVPLELAAMPADALESGSIGGIKISNNKLYEGNGNFKDANTGFYLDSSGDFSLKDKLSFDNSAGELAIDGILRAQTIDLTNGQIVGDVDATSIKTGHIDNDALSIDAKTALRTYIFEDTYDIRRDASGTWGGTGFASLEPTISAQFGYLRLFRFRIAKSWSDSTTSGFSGDDLKATVTFGYKPVQGTWVDLTPVDIEVTQVETPFGYAFSINEVVQAERDDTWIDPIAGYFYRAKITAKTTGTNVWSEAPSDFSIYFDTDTGGGRVLKVSRRPETYLEISNAFDEARFYVRDDTADGVFVFAGHGGGTVNEYINIDENRLLASVPVRAEAGITGLDINNGITGANFNITGVNQLTINDPGEGILFTGTNNVHLRAIDDANDNIMNFSGAAKVQVDGTDVITATGGTFTGAVTASSGFTANGLTYPTADGTSGQVITTDGSGNLSFTSAAGGSVAFDDLTDKTSGTGAYTTTGSFNAATLTGTTATINGQLVVGGTGVSTNEGGEIKLTYATGTTLSGGGAILDQNVDRIRFFEEGGTNRGAYIELTDCAGGAASEIWHSGNDGAGSGLAADTLDGFHAASASGDRWGHIPRIESTGEMEIGRYVDWHYSDADTSDYDARSEITSTGVLRHTTAHGYIDLGPNNSSYAHISTDRSQFYFNKKIIVDEGIIKSYNEDLQLGAGYGGSTSITIDHADNEVTFNEHLNLASGTRINHNGDASRDKIRLWNSSAYAIGMDNAMSYGHLSDYAITFHMSNTANRGWVFLDTAHSDSQGAMSLTTNGRMTVATSLSIGEGESVTSPQTDVLYVEGNPNFAVMPTFETPGKIIISRADNVTREHEIRFDNSSLASDNYIKFAVHNATPGSMTEVLGLFGDNRAQVFGAAVIGSTSALASSFNASANRLIVGDGAGNEGLTIFSGATSYGSIHFADTATTGGGSYNGYINHNQNNAKMTFGTNAAARMDIDSAGNVRIITGDLVVSTGDVGIGEANPAYKLDLIGSIRIQEDGQTGYTHSRLITESNSTSRGSGHFMWTSPGATEWYMGRPYQVGDEWMVARRQGGTSHSDATADRQYALLTVKNSGRVGIGEKDPDSMLEVNSGALGTTGGNELPMLNLQFASSNLDKLTVTARRKSTGTDWQTAAHKIQRTVDITDMGYIQFGKNGADDDLLTFGKGSTEYMRIDGVGDVGINKTNPSAKFHVNGTARFDHSETHGFRTQVTDSTANQSFYAHYFDINMSGSDACTADRTHYGMYIDVDSSASGGDTSNEHRVYGIYSDVRVTGDSDLVYAGYNYARSDHSSGTISSLRGVTNSGMAHNSSGTVSNVYGAFNLAYDFTSGTGAATNMYGSQNVALAYSTSPNGASSFFGTYNMAQVTATQSQNVSQIIGTYSEVQVDNNSNAITISNAYCYRAVYDYNDSDNSVTVNTGYLFFGDYQGTLPGTAYGIYITDEVRNFFRGTVSIGTSASPQTNLEINTPNRLGSSFTGTTDGEGLAVNQDNYVSGNYVSLVEGSHLSSVRKPSVRIGAKYTGTGSSLCFGTSDSYSSGITNLAMQIDPDGNVGIGAAPSAKLDIYQSPIGQVRFLYNNTSYNYIDVNNHFWRTAGQQNLMILTGTYMSLYLNAGSPSHNFQFNENGGEINLYTNTGASGTLIDLTTGASRFISTVNGHNLQIGCGGANTTGRISFMKAGFGSVAGEYLADGKFETSDVNSTNGSVIIQGRYSGTNVLATFGTFYSSGAPMIGYGVRPNNGGGGTVSSASNFAFYRSSIEISPDFVYKASSSSVSTAVGSSVSMSEKFRVTKTGVATLGVGTAADTGYFRIWYGSSGTMDLYGFGIQFNRGSNYLRPTTDGNKTLYFGNSNDALDWNTIHFRSVNGLYMTGTQFLTSTRQLVNITELGVGTSNPAWDAHIYGSGPTLMLESSSTADAELRFGYASSTTARIRENNDDLIFEAQGLNACIKTRPARTDILSGDTYIQSNTRLGGTSQMRINSSSSTAIMEGSSSFYVLRQTGSTSMSFQMGGSTETYGMTTNRIFPSADNARDLGSSTRRWADVYSAGGVTTSSDERLKQQIRDIDDAERRVAVAAKGLLKAYKYNDAVEKKGDSARWHIGIIAQELKSAFEAEGLDAHDYGMFMYTEVWEAQEWIVDVDSEEGGWYTTKTWETEAEAPSHAVKKDEYAIRYQELLAFIIAAI